MHFSRIYLKVLKILFIFMFVLQEGCYRTVGCKMSHCHCSSNSLSCKIQKFPNWNYEVMRPHISCVLKSLLSRSTPIILVEKKNNKKKANKKEKGSAGKFIEIVDWIMRLNADGRHENILKFIVQIILMLCKKKTH